MAPESAGGEVLGGKSLSEEAQESSNKWNRFVSMLSIHDYHIFDKTPGSNKFHPV